MEQPGLSSRRGVVERDNPKLILVRAAREEITQSRHTLHRVRTGDSVFGVWQDLHFRAFNQAMNFGCYFNG